VLRGIVFSSIVLSWKSQRRLQVRCPITQSAALSNPIQSSAGLGAILTQPLSSKGMALCGLLLSNEAEKSPPCELD
jgi:hypothetical protein